MNSAIEEMIAQCSVCQHYQPSQTAEPMIPHLIPTSPGMKLGADLCDIDGKKYLVTKDYGSGMLDVFELRSETSSSVINALKHLFAKDGVPYEVFTDNGPCFSSAEFAQFAEEWDFKHNTSSPLFSQSNGMAENGVKIAKRIFQKCRKAKQDPYLGLLKYRASPLACGKSPAEMHYGRNIRDNLPEMKLTKLDPVTTKRKAQQKLKQQDYYNRQTTPLEPLRNKDIVRVQSPNGNWDSLATVIREVAPRSYLIRTDRGSVLRRNRRHLRLTQESPQENPEPSYSDLLDNMMSSLNRSVQQSPPVSSTTPQVPAIPDVPPVPQTPVPPSPRPLAPTPRVDTPPQPSTPRPRRTIRRPDRYIEQY
jgi:transposase InsO family protein